VALSQHFGTEGAIADSDHLAGALIITVAVCAMAEVARPLRFINILFGIWLIGAPWLLAANGGATWNDIIAGLPAIGLSLPRGAEVPSITAPGTSMCSNESDVFACSSSVLACMAFSDGRMT
jgi:hypothetical protein